MADFSLSEVEGGSGSGLRIGDYVATENTTTESGNTLIPADGREIDAGTYPELSNITPESLKGVPTTFSLSGLVADGGIVGSVDNSKMYIWEDNDDIASTWDGEFATSIGITTLTEDMSTSIDGEFAIFIRAGGTTMEWQTTSDGGATLNTRKFKTIPTDSDCARNHCVQVNADGTEILFARELDSVLTFEKSVDSGVTFNPISTLDFGVNTFANFTSSRDLSTVVVSALDGYLSTDGGVTFSSLPYDPLVKGAGSTNLKVAINTDGSKIAIFSDTTGVFQISEDSGATWDVNLSMPSLLSIENGYGSIRPKKVEFSEDGSTLAVHLNTSYNGSNRGYTVLSRDLGLSWTIVHTYTGNNDSLDAVISSDGTQIHTLRTGEFIYVTDVLEGKFIDTLPSHKIVADAL